MRQLKTLVPLEIRSLGWEIKERTENASAAKVPSLLQSSIDFIRSFGLPLNIDRVLSVPVLRDRLLYIAMFLYKHRANLDV